jgi:hypothetical protein
MSLLLIFFDKVTNIYRQWEELMEEDSAENKMGKGSGKRYWSRRQLEVR